MASRPLGIAGGIFEDDYLCAFGAISILWADVEASLTDLLEVYLASPRRIAQRLASEIASESSRKIQYLRRLAKLTYSESEPEFERLSCLLSIASELRVKRNKLLHTVWLRMREERMEGVKPEKDGSQSKMDVNLDELSDLAEKIDSLATELSRLNTEKREARSASP